MEKKVALVALLLAVAAAGTVFARDLPMVDAGKDSASAVKQNLVLGNVTVVRCATNDKVKDGFELFYKAKGKYTGSGDKKKLVGPEYIFNISVFYGDGNTVNFRKSITFTENGDSTALKIDAKDAANIRGVAIHVKDASFKESSLSDWWSNYWKKKNSDWMDKHFPPSGLLRM
jgi:type 1 fimbria pilin